MERGKDFVVRKQGIVSGCKEMFQSRGRTTLIVKQLTDDDIQVIKYIISINLEVKVVGKLILQRV